MQEYWPLTEANHLGGAVMELRASLAWQLLEKWGLVSGHTSREDTTGRAVIDLMPVSETVARCFALADAFVAVAEKRGALRPFTDADCEKAMAEGGRLDRVRSEAEFPRERFEETLDRMCAKEKGK